MNLFNQYQENVIVGWASAHQLITTNCGLSPLQIREEIMNDLIIYNTDDGKSHVALLVVENEAWLTQNQLAELFDTSVQNIALHIKIY